jgi:hypothetical protein
MTSSNLSGIGLRLDAASSNCCEDSSHSSLLNSSPATHSSQRPRGDGDRASTATHAAKSQKVVQDTVPKWESLISSPRSAGPQPSSGVTPQATPRPESTPRERSNSTDGAAFVVASQESAAATPASPAPLCNTCGHRTYSASCEKCGADLGEARRLWESACSQSAPPDGPSSTAQGTPASDGYSTAYSSPEMDGRMRLEPIVPPRPGGAATTGALDGQSDEQLRRDVGAATALGGEPSPGAVTWGRSLLDDEGAAGAGCAYTTRRGFLEKKGQATPSLPRDACTLPDGR